MPVEKLSISFEMLLAESVKKAAAREGVNVSMWLAEAAIAKARNEHLREALDAFARAHGRLDHEEVEALIRAARKVSQVTKTRSTPSRRAKKVA